MRKQQKNCLDGDYEEIDTQNDRNNQQQVRYVSYLKFQKNILLVSTRNPLRIHQGMF